MPGAHTLRHGFGDQPMMQAVLGKIGEIFGADFENCGWKQNGGLALTGCVDSYVEQRQGIGEIGGCTGVGVDPPTGAFFFVSLNRYIEFVASVPVAIVRSQSGQLTYSPRKTNKTKWLES
jgi:hypothetical protein